MTTMNLASVSGRTEGSDVDASSPQFTAIPSTLVYGNLIDVSMAWDGTLWAVDEQGSAYQFDPIQQVWQPHGSGIDAAAVTPDGTTYLFQGNQYVVVKSGTQAASIPQAIADTWTLPNSFQLGITGAATVSGKLIFFKGGLYIPADGSAPAAKLTDLANWSQTDTWKAGVIDAVGSDSSGSIYLFRNGQFISVDLINKKVLTQPQPIANFPGWQNRLPAEWFTGIDAVCHFSNGTCAVFRGTAIALLQPNTTGVVTAQFIADFYANWPSTWLPKLLHAPSGRVGALWSVTANNGIVYHDGTIWNNASLPNQAKAMTVSVGADNSVHAATTDALHRLDNGNWTQVAPASFNVSQVAVGDSSRVWLRDDANNVYRYNSTNNSFDAIELVGEATHITANPDGTVWHCNSNDANTYRFISEGAAGSKLMTVADNVTSVQRVTSTSFGTSYCLAQHQDNSQQLYRYDSPYVFKTSDTYEMTLGTAIVYGYSKLFVVCGVIPTFYLAALDAQTGVEQWRYPFPNGCSNPIIDFVSNRLYLGTGNNGTIVALDVHSGELVWESSPTGAAIFTAPGLNGNLLAVINANGTLFLKDTTASPEQYLWQKQLGSGTASTPPPIFLNNQICGSDPAGKAYCVNVSDGSVVWNQAHYQVMDAALVVKEGSDFYSYFFHNGSVLKVNQSDDKPINKDPDRTITNYFPGVFEQGVDAAFRLDLSVPAPDNSNTSPSYLYFFRGNSCIKVDESKKKVQPGYPKPIAEEFSYFPAEFQQGIDASVQYGESATAGAGLVFCGNQVIEVNFVHGELISGPTLISQQFQNWPAAFQQGIDAAIVYPQAIYLFREQNYIILDRSLNLTAGPIEIAEGFPEFQKFPAFTQGELISAASVSVQVQSDALGNPSLYFCNATSLLAIDGKTGFLRWFTMPSSGQFFAPSVQLSQQTLYVGNGTNLSAIDALTGKHAWTTQFVPQTNLTVQSNMVVDSGFLYFGCSTNEVYKFNLDTQQVEEVWETGQTEILNLSPQLINGTLYVGGFKPNSLGQILAVRFDAAVQDFIVESQLMQDYDAVSSGSEDLKTVARYQTHVTIVDDVKAPRANESVKVWAESDEVITVLIDGQPFSISTTQCAIVHTAPDGTLTIVSDADDLFATPLRLWAGFMDVHERIVVYPDREFHSSLANVTADPTNTDPNTINLATAQGYNNQPLLKDQSNAQQIASTIQNTMAIVTASPSNSTLQADPGSSKYTPYSDLPGMSYFPCNTPVVRSALIQTPSAWSTTAPTAENWLAGMDAACTDYADNTYLFCGSQVIKVDASRQVVEGYPKALSDACPTWSPDLQQGIDAAATRNPQETYIFKGSQYMVVKPDTLEVVQPLQPISTTFTQWPYDFQQGIDAIVPWNDGTGWFAYIFKGQWILRAEWQQSLTTVDPRYLPYGIRITDATLGFTNLPNAFQQGIGAGTVLLTSEQAYFFRGEQAIAITMTTRSAIAPAFALNDATHGYPGLPAPTADSRLVHTELAVADAHLAIDQMQTQWIDGFDSAVRFAPLNNAASGQFVYLFKGTECIKLEESTLNVVPNYPRPIRDEFPYFPESFNQSIDAGIQFAENGEALLFSGSQYIRVNFATGTLEEGPKEIAAGLPSLPAAFQSGIDAAVVYPDRLYLFAGNQCVAIDRSTFHPLSGYEQGKPIATEFAELSPSFQEGLSNAFNVLTNNGINVAYLLKGDRVVAMDETSKQFLPGYTSAGKLISEVFPNLPDVTKVLGVGGFLSWFRSLWDKVKRGIADIAHVVISIGKEVYCGIRFIVNGVVHVIKGIIHDVIDAVSNIGAIFKAIRKAIKDVVEAFSILLHFDEIFKTQTFLINQFNQVDSLLKQKISDQVGDIPGWFDRIKLDISDAINYFIGKIDSDDIQTLEDIKANLPDDVSKLHGSGTTSHTLFTTGPKDKSKPASSHSVVCTWGLNKIKENYRKATEPSTNLLLSSASLPSSIVKVIEDFAENVVSDVSGDFDNFNTLFKQHFHITSIEDFCKMALTILLTALEDLINACIDLIKDLIIGILTAANEMLDWFLGDNGMFAGVVDIPILSALYRKFTGENLSFLNLITLVFSIPITMVYRVVEGHYPSLYLQQELLEDSSNQVALRVFGILIGLAYFANGIFSGFSDGASAAGNKQVPFLGKIATLISVAIQVAQSTVLLLTPKVSKTDWIVLFLGFPPLFASAIEETIVQAPATSFTTLIQFGTYLIQKGVDEKAEDWIAFAGNLTGAVPNIAQPLKLFGPETVEVSVVLLAALDFYCNTATAGCTFTETALNWDQ
ncbi:hemopexin repeat-containing protein (plasmid) [Kovacikia minuta CCNUW1]|uniref:hemopexin repeat-containing protein n=1 Tax=Kovacikia minuta TaxID=2931930 RepID=UPI001CCE81D6|nr:hemopexin repeat-containing protein [Kovacikia minuta]UBF29769.1 hemopexin repeat-containing protein [Kovacikia minuta CCNUW1]